MKKLITICVGLIVAGCATTTQLDEANAKIQDLEKRLTAIEMKANLASRSPFVSHIPCLRAQSMAEEQKGSDGTPATNTIARTQSQPGNGAGGFISARRRREQREAEAAAEDKKRREVEEQREAEREEQRKQLQLIQEELRRVRESKAAEMAKEDGREAEAVAKEEERKRAEAEKAAKEAEEKKAVDAKIDAFLKEHLGVQFGDSIDKSPGEKQDANPNTRRGALLRSRGLAGEPTNSADTRNIPVLKKFKYFDKAYGKFFEGKLYRVEFRANIDKKYSFDSTREKINQAVADLAATLGLESSAFKDEPWHGVDAAPSHAYFRSMTSAPRTSYTLDKIFQSYLEDVWVYTVSFEDAGLRNRLREEKRKAEAEERRKKNAEGETLPDPE